MEGGATKGMSFDRLNSDTPLIIIGTAQICGE